MSLKSEIFEQPAVLDRLLRTQAGPARDVARSIRSRGVHWVLIAARGSSDHAALYAKYLWGSRNGLPVALAAPSLYTLYHTPPRLQGVLVVGISLAISFVCSVLEAVLLSISHSYVAILEGNGHPAGKLLARAVVRARWWCAIWAPPPALRSSEASGIRWATFSPVRAPGGWCRMQRWTTALRRSGPTGCEPSTRRSMPASRSTPEWPTSSPSAPAPTSTSGSTTPSSMMRPASFGMTPASSQRVTDQQARRAGIRWKAAGTKGTEVCHTVNGSAMGWQTGLRKSVCAITTVS